MYCISSTTDKIIMGVPHKIQIYTFSATLPYIVIFFIKYLRKTLAIPGQLNTDNFKIEHDLNLICFLFVYLVVSWSKDNFSG